MTRFFTQDTHCPICNAAIAVRHLMSTNTFGGQDTDFRSHAVGFDPLHIVMNQCASCGYSDFSPYFDKPREMSDVLKQRIRKEIHAVDDPSDSHRYATAAQIAEIRGAALEEIANLYLNAAWCCQDENDTQGEKSFRKLAISNFISALDSEEIKDSKRVSIIYLVGELYRRIGDSENAQNWFNRVIAMDDDSEHVAQYRKIAEQQRDNPKEQF